MLGLKMGNYLSSITERGSRMRVHPLQKTITYGPVNSTRLGRSLGIHLMPTTYKLCSFDCIYCVYGWTDVRTTDLTGRTGDLPQPEQVGQELESTLKSIRGIDYITFSGSGECTLHPDFAAIVDIVLTVRNKFRPDTPLAILSNSSMAHREEVRIAIEKLDRRIMKLDCGTQESFQAVNRPAPEVGYDQMLPGLENMQGIEIQTMFLENGLRNTSEGEIDAWMEKVRRVKPIGVQLCSIHHPPADQSITGLSDERLTQIAERVQKELGIPARAY